MSVMLTLTLPPFLTIIAVRNMCLYSSLSLLKWSRLFKNQVPEKKKRTFIFREGTHFLFPVTLIQTGCAAAVCDCVSYVCASEWEWEPNKTQAEGQTALPLIEHHRRRDNYSKCRIVFWMEQIESQRSLTFHRQQLKNHLPYSYFPSSALCESKWFYPLSCVHGYD